MNMPIRGLSRRAIFLLLPISLLFAACQNVGPHGIRQGRHEYNAAIRQTNDEQLLLNLVRLQYRDTPLFLQVGSVSSQMRFDASTGLGAGFRSPGRALQSYGADARIGVADTPTISYSPLQGEEFTEHLLQPISIESILLLYHSGWSIERVMRLTVQRMNGRRNAFNASGPTPDYPPRFEEFVRVARLFRSLQILDGIDMGYEVVGGQRTPYLYVTAEGARREEWREAAALLGIDPDRSSYLLRPGTALRREETGEIVINTRSLMGVLHFLSQAVDVPADHRQAGLVTITPDADGNAFDWNVVLDNLIQIRHSRKRPSGAAVAVEHRGHWFYIDDSDLQAKSTFTLVSQLFELQTGRHTLTAPLLTLPIGQ